MKPLPHVAIIFALLVLFLAPAVNAATYLQMVGVDGDVTTTGYEGWIRIESVNLQMSRPDADPRAAPILRPVVVTKPLDTASVPLYLKLLTGDRTDQAILVYTEDSLDARREYWRIELFGVVVSNVSQTYDENEGSPATESIALNFNRICYKYTPPAADGSPPSPISACWDLSTNSLM